MTHQNSPVKNIDVIPDGYVAVDLFGERVVVQDDRGELPIHVLPIPVGMRSLHDHATEAMKALAAGFCIPIDRLLRHPHNGSI